MNNNALREAKNEVKIEGILKESNLKKIVANGENAISGRIVVLVNKEGVDNEVTVNSFVKEFKKDGKINPGYTNLNGFMNNGVSMAYLMASQGMSEQEARANASCVRTSGATLKVNEYYRPDGTLSTRYDVSCNFIRVISNPECTPTAEFDVECYFDKIRKEMKDGEETGRIYLDTYIPVYGGAVIPMTFVADGDVAEYMVDNYMPKRSSRIFGHFVSSVERKETVYQGFGRPKVDVTTTYKHELVIDGGEPEQYDPESPKAFSPEAIQVAVQVRETEYLPGLKKKQTERNTKNNAGGFGGATANNGRPSIKW